MAHNLKEVASALLSRYKDMSQLLEESKERANVKSLSDIIKKNEEELIDYKDQLSVANNDLSRLSEEYDKISKNYEDKCSQELILRVEMDKLAQHNTSLQIESNEHIRKCQDLNDQLNKAQQQLEEANSENANLINEFTKLSLELEKSKQINSTNLFEAIQQLSLIILSKSSEQLNEKTFEMIKKAFSSNFLSIIRIYEEYMENSLREKDLLSQGLQKCVLILTRKVLLKNR
jgi:hypothetical protein